LKRLIPITRIIIYKIENFHPPKGFMSGSRGPPPKGNCPPPFCFFLSFGGSSNRSLINILLSDRKHFIPYINILLLKDKFNKIRTYLIEFLPFFSYTVFMFELPEGSGADADPALMTESVKALLEGETDLIAGLANVSAVLNCRLPNINWVGFYLLKGTELVLGPFQGLPACIRIGEGKGVCGRAAYFFMG
jgi:hypothetical protein